MCKKTLIDRTSSWDWQKLVRILSISMAIYNTIKMKATIMIIGRLINIKWNNNSKLSIIQKVKQQILLKQISTIAIVSIDTTSKIY